MLFLLRQRRRGEEENDTRVGKESECSDHPSFYLTGLETAWMNRSPVSVGYICPTPAPRSGLLAYGCRRFLFNVNDLASYERGPTVGSEDVAKLVL